MPEPGLRLKKMTVGKELAVSRICLVIAALLAVQAQAQSVGTQAASPVAGDDGIALSDDGRSRLHLGITAGAGFDTNPYTTPQELNQFTGDVVVRIRPYLDVSVPGSSLAFSGKAQLDYGFLPGVVTPDTQSFLLYQTLLGVDLELNRGGAFSFAVGDSVSWNTDPGVTVVGSLLSRVRNRMQAGAGYRPGNGILSTRLQYTFDFTKFVDVQGNGGPVTDGVLDTMTHSLRLRGDYRFLPKTGVFAALVGGWQSYPFDSTQPSAFPVSVNVGLQGNILPKLAFLLSAGYSNPLVFDGSGLVTGNIVGAVGQAEIQWALSPVTRLSGGFRRTFDPIALYQFVGNNRAYGRFAQTLGQLEFNLNAGYSALEFGEEQSGPVPLTDRQTGRFDHAIDGSIGVDFYVFRWLSFGVRNSIDWRITNARIASSSLGLDYVRNETLVVANARY